MSIPTPQKQQRQKRPPRPVTTELRAELLAAARELSPGAEAITQAYLSSRGANEAAARVLVLGLLPHLRSGPAGVKFKNIRAAAELPGAVIDPSWKGLVKGGWLRIEREPQMVRDPENPAHVITHHPRVYGLGARSRAVLRALREQRAAAS